MNKHGVRIIEWPDDAKEIIEELFVVTGNDGKVRRFPGDADEMRQLSKDREGYDSIDDLVQDEYKKDEELQNAISCYLNAHGLEQPGALRYGLYQAAELGFFKSLHVGELPVLIMLYSFSTKNDDIVYIVYETVHTRKLLKSSHETSNAELAIAV